MTTTTRCHALLLALLLALAGAAARADVELDIRQLQRRWAEVNYQFEGKPRLDAFAQLTADAERVTARYPDAAAAWIWSGIIKSSYAGAKGGLGALGLAKASRADLEKAMTIDDTALSGSAYTSLGTLYFKVPGWPLGFGDDKKAKQLLQKALAINPDGIDSNYFYAEFLREQGDYKGAQEYLLKARRAPPRPDRQLADQGRQGEITAALALVDQKLHK